MNLADGYALLMQAAADAWQIPPKLSVSDWADTYRMLPNESSSEPGRWRTSRTPYSKEPMDELGASSATQEVVIMAASQVMKTEVLLNFVFWSMHQDPSSMLVVQPTEKGVNDFVSQRLDPAIKMMDVIKELVPPDDRKASKIKQKTYPGGVLYMGWSNSPTELAGKPIKKLALDEVDRYPVSLKDNGSTVAQAVQRTANYPRRKILKTSTPKVKGASAIADDYEASSQGQYWVPCPHCEEMQVLRFEQVRWHKTQSTDGKTIHWPETAHYVCEHHGCIINESDKPAMLAGGQWRHRYPDRARRGYHINGFYSPLGLGWSWAERVTIFLESKDDPAKLQTFVNLHLGEPYEDHSEQLQAAALQQRAEPYPLRTIPAGYTLLTLGVDVQRAGYFALHLVAWGRGERFCTIDYTEIPGDPTRAEDWECITTYRRRPVRNAFGVDLRISGTAIDAGDGATMQEAYRYARLHQHDGVMVVKGHSQPNRPVLGRPSKQDVRNDTGSMDKHGVQLWMVGTDTAKSTLFARLDGDADRPPADRMARFSAELPLRFFEGLTSEYYDTDTGRYIKRPGRRNEPLDTWVYAYAAAHRPGIAIHTARHADWDELERLYEPRVPDLFASLAPMPVTGTADQTQADAVPEQDPQPARQTAADTPAVIAGKGDHSDHDDDNGSRWLPDLSNWLD